MSKKRSNRNSRKVLKALKQKRANSARTNFRMGGGGKSKLNGGATSGGGPGKKQNDKEDKKKDDTTTTQTPTRSNNKPRGSQPTEEALAANIAEQKTPTTSTGVPW